MAEVLLVFLNFMGKMEQYLKTDLDATTRILPPSE
jgi:hypothetical protein